MKKIFFTWLTALIVFTGIVSPLNIISIASAQSTEDGCTTHKIFITDLQSKNKVLGLERNATNFEQKKEFFEALFYVFETKYASNLPTATNLSTDFKLRTTPEIITKMRDNITNNIAKYKTGLFSTKQVSIIKTYQALAGLGTDGKAGKNTYTKMLSDIGGCSSQANPTNPPKTENPGNTSGDETSGQSPNNPGPVDQIEVGSLPTCTPPTLPATTVGKKGTNWSKDDHQKAFQALDWIFQKQATYRMFFVVNSAKIGTKLQSLAGVSDGNYTEKMTAFTNTRNQTTDRINELTVVQRDLLLLYQYLVFANTGGAFNEELWNKNWDNPATNKDNAVKEIDGAMGPKTKQKMEEDMAKICGTNTPGSNSPASPTTNGASKSSGLYLVPDNPGLLDWAKVNPKGGDGVVRNLVWKVIDWLLGFLGLLAVIMIMWAGYNYITSQGDDTQQDEARDTITWALIGLVLVILAESIVQIIFPTVGGDLRKDQSALDTGKVFNTAEQGTSLAFSVINWLLGFLSILAIIMVIYAGFLYVTSLGETEKQDKARDMITWAVVGIIIILISYTLVNTVIGGVNSIL